jgi:hypothetical protein
LKSVTTFSNNYGVEVGVKILQPEWSGTTGVVGESILPAIIDTKKELSKQNGCSN